MLDNWEENLAIIAANRTKGDELVCVHLGDCLWKERWEVGYMYIFLIIRYSFLLLSIILRKRNFAGYCCTCVLFSCRIRLGALFRQCKALSHWCRSFEISSNIC